MKKLLGVMPFVILMGVTFSQVHTYVETYQNVHFMYSLLYINYTPKKNLFFKKEKTEKVAWK